jgi:predicted MFS family arabinose efflux permease
LDEGQAALVETMLSLGAVIGALTYSWLSLKVGRLRLLNLTAVAVLVLNYLTGITDDFYYFLGIRTL